MCTKKTCPVFQCFSFSLNEWNKNVMTSWKSVGQCTNCTCIQDVIEANVRSLNVSIISEYCGTRSGPTSSWQ